MPLCVQSVENVDDEIQKVLSTYDLTVKAGVEAHLQHLSLKGEVYRGNENQASYLYQIYVLTMRTFVNNLRNIGGWDLMRMTMAGSILRRESMHMIVYIIQSTHVQAHSFPPLSCVCHSHLFPDPPRSHLTS